MRCKLAPALALCSMLAPVAAVASQASTGAAITTNLRVSTGVKAPIILDTAEIALPQDVAVDSLPAGAQVGLALTVDQYGVPRNIRVVKSLSPSLDESVVEAVRHFRFRPGSMDNQPVPVDLNLTVTIDR
ncbi:MAG TPA: TonB family protein [Terracidiphilus sp.]|nr:TonB family protein [Terracidiphilus sp.]